MPRESYPAGRVSGLGLTSKLRSEATDVFQCMRDAEAWKLKAELRADVRVQAVKLQDCTVNSATIPSLVAEIV